MIPHPRLHLVAVLALFLLSGFTGLVFQVLWMRELALLFGSTAEAAGATLGAFFLGLAAGGAYWGQRSPRLTHPLKTYALLELAVAASALPFLGLTGLFQGIYGALYGGWGAQPELLLAHKSGSSAESVGEYFARGERQVDDVHTDKGWRRGAPSGWFFRHEQQALAKIAKNAKGTAVSSSGFTMRVMPCSMSAAPNWTP